MMMRMVEAGGIPAVYNEHVRPRDQHNPYGYYETKMFLEMEPLAIRNIDYVDGKVVKVLATGLERWPPSTPAKVVFMQRNDWERQHSMFKLRTSTMAKRSLPCDLPPPPTGPAVVDGRVWRQLVALEALPHLDILRVPYTDVARDPLKAAHRVQAHLGVPLDVNAMASIYKHNLYRNRSWEDNCAQSLS